MRDIIEKLEKLNVTEAKSPPEVINPTKDSSPADLKAAIKYAKYMKAKMDTDKAKATYDKEIAQLEGWLKKKSVMKEDLADMAHEAEKDHEVQMARSDLYKSAKYAVAIHKMMKDISEMEGIDGWVASKITKAADYLSSVKHHMEGQMMADVELAVVPVAGDMTDAMSVPQEDIEEVHEEKHEDHAKLHKAIKKKLKDEGGAAGMEPLKKVAKDMGIDLTPAMLSKMDGVKKHKDGDYILENINEDDTDYPQVVARNTDKENVMAILKKYPQETKKMQMSGDLMDIYDTDLYMDLFDYFSEEMPYGTQKARDGDPVQYMSDELDDLGLLDLPDSAMEDTMNANFMKQMSKSQEQQNTKSQQDMINSIIAKLPRDDNEKGLGGNAQSMPDVKKATVNPVTQQKMANIQALPKKRPIDYTQSDRTGSFSTMANWGKK